MYNPTIDLLRFVSILAVILIHTTTKTFQITNNDLIHLPITLFFNQAARFAVPLFFLISGFVLELNYSRQLNYWEYLKKRFSKIFIPYVFWSAIYFYLIYPGLNQNLFISLIAGSASYQLYFIPALLVFYFIFPLFHRLIVFFSRRPTLLLLGLIEIGLLYQDYYLQPAQFFYPLKVALFNVFIFIFGMVVAKKSDLLIKVIRAWRWLLLGLTLILADFIFYQSGSLYYKTGNYLFFYSNWRPLVLPYTISLSAVLYYFFNYLKLKPSLIKSMSGLSFFVFFCHIIVLEKLWPLIDKRFIGAVWYDPVFFLAVALLSFSFAYLSHKIPYLSKLTG